MGYDSSERTVRFHLLGMDKEGLTRNFGKRGRLITDKGRDELNNARVIEKVGYLAAKIDQMTYQMDFDLNSRSGMVVVNVSMINLSQLKAAAPLIAKVYEHGYAMGSLVGLLGPGESIGDESIPDNMVGICTVCSITLNGVLLANGIPTYSRFGGLLELQKTRPTRFVEIIHYVGTTLDPLEVFIRSGMTDYTGAIATGNGRIGASFREVPAMAREKVTVLAEKLEKVGLGGFMEIGWPGQPVREIPVNSGQIGAILIGGLNPAAILEEQGIKTYSRALAGLYSYQNLFHYELLQERINFYW
jgi:hypothetical protein